MSCCRNLFSSCLTTVAAGISFLSYFCAGYFFRHFTLSPSMPRRFKSLLRNQNFITNRTMTSFGFTNCFTSWLDYTVCHLSMTGGWNYFCFGCFADCTGIGLYTRFCAGWFLCYFSLIPAMSCCWDFCLCHKHFIADRTMTSFYLSWICASWINCIIYYLGVTDGWDLFCFCFFADCTGVSLYALFFTGCRCCYFSDVPGMSFLGNDCSFFYNCITVFAYLISCITFFTTSCLFCISYFNMLMSSCFYFFCSCFFADCAGISLHSCFCTS